MTFQTVLTPTSKDEAPIVLPHYMELIGLVERMHRLLLDVIKDEFERLDVVEINPVQALLLFNISENEVTAGELRSKGYYQGSNVSYNLKKLVDTGYLSHQRSEVDRRSVRVKLTDKGHKMRSAVGELFVRHSVTLGRNGTSMMERINASNTTMRMMEKFWTDQIRYIY